MSLSLTSIVFISAIYFYASFRKTTEENIINLQLPAIIDACFIAIEDTLKQQACQGIDLTSRRAVLPNLIYGSNGRAFSPKYTYSVQVLQEMNKSVDGHRAYLLIVDMVLELGSNNTISEQRSLCLVT